MRARTRRHLEAADKALARLEDQLESARRAAFDGGEAYTANRVTQLAAMMRAPDADLISELHALIEGA